MIFPAPIIFVSFIFPFINWPLLDSSVKLFFNWLVWFNFYFFPPEVYYYIFNLIVIAALLDLSVLFTLYFYYFPLICWLFLVGIVVLLCVPLFFHWVDATVVFILSVNDPALLFFFPVFVLYFDHLLHSFDVADSFPVKFPCLWFLPLFSFPD